jgi:hypothetical protein
MNVTLPVYKDDAGFHQALYRTFIVEQLEIIGYETVSVTLGTYAFNETYNVKQGDILLKGDRRGIELLKLRNKLTGEYVWVKATKEYITDMQNLPINPFVIVNNYTNVGTGSGIKYPYEWFAVDPSLDYVTLTGIGTATDLIIEKNGSNFAEWQLGMAFNAADLPVGKKYKVDPATERLYFGEPWLEGERLYIRSDKQLTLV